MLELLGIYSIKPYLPVQMPPLVLIAWEAAGYELLNK